MRESRPEAGRLGALIRRHVGAGFGHMRRLGVADALAQVAGTAATLRALAAGAEYVGRTAGARTDGGVYVTFPNGPADAKIHVVPGAESASANYSQSGN
jgi:hypothetical protein